VHWNAFGSRKFIGLTCCACSSWLVDYPFADRLYPGAMDAVMHVRQWGTTVILSDGDAVFQPRKVERSGLWQAFEDHVLTTISCESWRR
jgi:hypothetical protein